MTSNSNLSNLKLAGEKLRTNNLRITGLPGREKQIDELYTFIYERLKIRQIENVKRKSKKADDSITLSMKNRHLNKTMFVCGIPGTGKTAVVLHVIEKLKTLLKNNKDCPLMEFEPIYINGQHLTAPERVYSEILYRITGHKMGPERAQDELEAMIGGDCKDSEDEEDSENDKTKRTGSERPPKRKVSIARTKKLPPTSYKLIVIDELDVLYTERRQSVFYSLFDMPTRATSKIILIAIANAMDLPERFMRGRIGSRLGWNKLVFDSYTSDCLRKILEAKLGEGLMKKTFTEAAITLATKRISRSTGDARRIIDTCILAIKQTIETGCSKVDPKIIDQVGFQNLDMMQREYLDRCPKLELLVLNCILLQAAKNGADHVDGIGVYTELMQLIKNKGLLDTHEIGIDGFFNLLNTLAGVGQIYMEPNKPLLNKHLSLINTSDVYKDYIMDIYRKYSEE